MWLVNLGQSRADWPELMLIQELVGKHIVDAANVGIDDTVHDPPHRHLIDPFGERIDRQDAAGRHVLVSGQISDLGMHHFPAATRPMM